MAALLSKTKDQVVDALAQATSAVSLDSSSGPSPNLALRLRRLSLPALARDSYTDLLLEKQ
jgi:hypothetical protein